MDLDRYLVDDRGDRIANHRFFKHFSNKKWDDARSPMTFANFWVPLVPPISSMILLVKHQSNPYFCVG
jgi:hypothetical protein